MTAAALPSLVFAHYFGGSTRSWSPLVAALGGKFECSVPNLPGFGGATPLAAEASLEAYAHDFARRAPSGDWIAIGHSMGGKIVLAAAAHRPAGLIALILVATSPPTPEPMAEGERASSLEAWGDRAAANVRIDAVAEGRLEPSIRASCVADALSADRTAWAWWLERGSRDDISTETSRLDLPILVISGGLDQVIGRTIPSTVHGLRGAELDVIAGAGHLVPLEKPVATAASIIEFIGRVPSGGQS